MTQLAGCVNSWRPSEGTLISQSGRQCCTVHWYAPVVGNKLLKVIAVDLGTIADEPPPTKNVTVSTMAIR